MFSYRKDSYGYHLVTTPTPFMVGPANFIIVEKPTGLTLVDAGADSDEAWGMLQQSLDSLGYSLDELDEIVLTHHHADHIGLVNRIVKRRSIPVYAHPNAIPRLMRDRDFLLFRADFFETLYREMGCGETGDRYVEQLRINISKNEHLKLNAEVAPIQDRLPIRGLEHWEPIFTPGHAPDHLVFYDRQRQALIAGDHILPHTSTNAFVEPDERGNRLQSVAIYRNSLELCKPLVVSVAFPGHGEAFGDHIAVIENRLSRIDKKAEKILSYASNGEKTAFEICKEMYPHRYETIFSLAMSETIGLLDFLESTGRIQKNAADRVWRYSVK